VLWASASLSLLLHAFQVACLCAEAEEYGLKDPINNKLKAVVVSQGRRTLKEARKSKLVFYDCSFIALLFYDECYKL
jgi:hypothetical protein